MNSSSSMSEGVTMTIQSGESPQTSTVSAAEMIITTQHKPTTDRDHGSQRRVIRRTCAKRHLPFQSDLSQMHLIVANSQSSEPKAPGSATSSVNSGRSESPSSSKRLNDSGIMEKDSFSISCPSTSQNMIKHDIENPMIDSPHDNTPDAAETTLAPNEIAIITDHGGEGSKTPPREKRVRKRPAKFQSPVEKKAKKKRPSKVVKEEVVEPEQVPVSPSSDNLETEVEENDVILKWTGERCELAESHPGNLQYQYFLDDVREEYQNAGRKKSDIAMQLVERVYSLGGRFLESIDEIVVEGVIEARYVTLGTTAALQKICLTLSGDDNTETEIITSLKSNDVVLRRGIGWSQRVKQHPGNRQYQYILNDTLEDYKSAARTMKRDVAMRVLNRVHAIGGRFLEMAPSQSSQSSLMAAGYVLMKEEKVLERVCAYLRNKSLPVPAATSQDGGNDTETTAEKSTVSEDLQSEAIDDSETVNLGDHAIGVAKVNLAGVSDSHPDVVQAGTELNPIAEVSVDAQNGAGPVPMSLHRQLFAVLAASLPTNTKPPAKTTAKASAKAGKAAKSKVQPPPRTKPPRIKLEPEPVVDEKIDRPGVNDVILGRGNAVAKHSGNVQFRDYCWSVRAKYHKAWRNEKRQFALMIFDKVTRQKPAGRFVQFTNRGEWLVASKEKALEKICQALREKKWLAYGQPIKLPHPPKKGSYKAKVAEALKPSMLSPSNKTIDVNDPIVVSTASSLLSPSVTQEAGGVHAAGISPKSTPPSHQLMLRPPSFAKPDVSSKAQSPVVAVNPPKEAFQNPEDDTELLEDRKVPAIEKSASEGETRKRRNSVSGTPLSKVRTALIPGAPPKPIILDVGTRISVLWPLDNAYYDATIQRCSVNDHFLEYDDDGETEWLDLSKHEFKILSFPKGPK